jgi:hypothetical protein
VVPAGSSLPVIVTFDANELIAGSYFDTLHIVNNDPLRPLVNIPVFLNAIDNLPPQLEKIQDATVVETGVIKVSFTASDPDDDNVKIALHGLPPFITIASQAYGKTTYLVKPAIGNAGTYDLLVTAQDPRGLIDSAIFHLTVTPYGVSNFSLVNTVSGKVILDFDDSLTVDLAHPDFSKYTVRANANPAKVGSVIFRVDGIKRNTENIITYDLDRYVFTSLTLGTHRLNADAYTKASGNGIKGAGKKAVIKVINGARITRFEVVNRWGHVLKQLKEGDKINIKDPAFNNITIIAYPGESKVGSVYFKLNTFTHVENISLYSLNGNEHGYFNPYAFKVGKYKLTAVPYSKSNKNGVAGGSLTVNFEIVKERVSSIAAREAIDGDEEELTVNERLPSLWSVYPVPVENELHLKIENALKEGAEVSVINIQGQILYKIYLTAEKLQDHIISTTELGLVKGAYYIQVIDNRGKREIRKFLKN